VALMREMATDHPQREGGRDSRSDRARLHSRGTSNLLARLCRCGLAFVCVAIWAAASQPSEAVTGTAEYRYIAAFALSRIRDAGAINPALTQSLLSRYFDNPYTVLRLSNHAATEHTLSQVDREMTSNYKQAKRALSFPALHTYQYTDRRGQPRTANGFYEWLRECDPGDGPSGPQNRCYELLPQGSVVVYDLEWWNGPHDTPSPEELDPAPALKSFASLAHRYEWNVLFTTGDQINSWAWTSARGSARYPIPEPTPHGCVNNKKWNQLLSAAVFAKTAPYADFWDLQRQGLEYDHGEFVCDIQTAATQIRRANPRTIILVELGTDPGSGTYYHVSSGTEFLANYGDVKPYVDGYFFVVESAPHAEIMLDFLRLLYRQ
jgi:hypothetical protein